MYKILLIEDEEDLLTVLSYNLQKEGYIVETATTGQKGLEVCFSSSPPDLLLLDLNLPDMSGLDICSRLRKTKETANICIIMLTARSSDSERVSGFEVGADDYVPKPFNTRELLLRIRAWLRRIPKKTGILEVGSICVDIEQYRCTVEGKEVDLTALEFRLLQKFLEEKERVQSRELLLKEVWNMDPRINTRTVDKHIQRLRSKLGVAGDCIQTIRGVGYRMKI